MRPIPASPGEKLHVKIDECYVMWMKNTHKKKITECTQLYIGVSKIVFPLLPMALHVPMEKLLNPIFSI